MPIRLICKRKMGFVAMQNLESNVSKRGGDVIHIKVVAGSYT